MVVVVFCCCGQWNGLLVGVIGGGIIALEWNGMDFDSSGPCHHRSYKTETPFGISVPGTKCQMSALS